MESTNPCLSPTKLQLKQSPCLASSPECPGTQSSKALRKEGPFSRDGYPRGYTQCSSQAVCRQNQLCTLGGGALQGQRYHGLAHFPLPQGSPPVLAIEWRVWSFLFGVGAISCYSRYSEEELLGFLVRSVSASACLFVCLFMLDTRSRCAV